jgi:hypothetical protein
VGPRGIICPAFPAGTSLPLCLAGLFVAPCVWAHLRANLIARSVKFSFPDGTQVSIGHLPAQLRVLLNCE